MRLYILLNKRRRRANEVNLSGIIRNANSGAPAPCAKMLFTIIPYDFALWDKQDIPISYSRAPLILSLYYWKSHVGIIQSWQKNINGNRNSRTPAEDIVGKRKSYRPTWVPSGVRDGIRRFYGQWNMLLNSTNAALHVACFRVEL